MGVFRQFTDYYVEIIAMAIFLLSVYRIVIVIYSEPLSGLWYYLAIAVLSLFLMNYGNLGYHIKGKRRRA